LFFNDLGLELGADTRCQEPLIKSIKTMTYKIFRAQLLHIKLRYLLHNLDKILSGLIEVSLF